MGAPLLLEADRLDRAGGVRLQLGVRRAEVRDERRHAAGVDEARDVLALVADVEHDVRRLAGDVVGDVGVEHVDQVVDDRRAEADAVVVLAR